MKYRCIIGLDIGGTKTAVVEGSDEGRILRRLQFGDGAATGF